MGWEQVLFDSSVGGWAVSARCGYTYPTLSIMQHLLGLYSFGQTGMVHVSGWFCLGMSTAG